MMIDDPIVDEIRQIRRSYAQSLNNDLHAICEDLRQQEKESGQAIRTPTTIAPEESASESK